MPPPPATSPRTNPRGPGKRAPPQPIGALGPASIVTPGNAPSLARLCLYRACERGRDGARQPRSPFPPQDGGGHRRRGDLWRRPGQRHRRRRQEGSPGHPRGHFRRKEGSGERFGEAARTREKATATFQPPAFSCACALRFCQGRLGPARPAVGDRLLVSMEAPLRAGSASLLGACALAGKG